MDKRDKGDAKNHHNEAVDAARVAETKKKFLDTLALESVGGLVFLACQVSGIAKSYIYRLRSSDPKFTKEWDQIVNSADEIKGDIAEAKLMELVKAGNPASVMFALKKYKKRKFGDQADSPTEINIEHEVSPEYREMVEELLNRHRKTI